MREEFIKKSNFVEEFKPEDLNVFEEIEVSKKKLKAYYSNLNFVNGNMIDYYVYQIKAEEAKFAYLMKEAKRQIGEENK